MHAPYLYLYQGDAIVPGTISATPVNGTCLDVEGGLNMHQPLVYFYGQYMIY